MLRCQTRRHLGRRLHGPPHAASASEALSALARSTSIDVVLSDIMMSGGTSGIELAREIRRRNPSLPVLLTTGYIGVAADLKDGECVVLPKPLSLEALVSALRSSQAQARTVNAD